MYFLVFLSIYASTQYVVLAVPSHIPRCNASHSCQLILCEVLCILQKSSGPSSLARAKSLPVVLQRISTRRDMRSTGVCVSALVCLIMFLPHILVSSPALVVRCIYRPGNKALQNIRTPVQCSLSPTSQQVSDPLQMISLDLVSSASIQEIPVLHIPALRYTQQALQSRGASLSANCAMSTSTSSIE